MLLRFRPLPCLWPPLLSDVLLPGRPRSAVFLHAGQHCRSRRGRPERHTGELHRLFGRPQTTDGHVYGNRAGHRTVNPGRLCARTFGSCHSDRTQPGCSRTIEVVGGECAGRNLRVHGRALARRSRRQCRLDPRTRPSDRAVELPTGTSKAHGSRRTTPHRGAQRGIGVAASAGGPLAALLSSASAALQRRDTHRACR